MKLHTTRKAIVNGFSNIRSAGYCDLQALLHYRQPIAYTHGIYGWNFDVYDVNGLTICTGYRNMPGKRLDCINAYEEQAKKIIYNWDDGLTFEQKKEAVEKLLSEFCKLNMK